MVIQFKCMEHMQLVEDMCKYICDHTEPSLIVLSIDHLINFIKMHTFIVV